MPPIRHVWIIDLENESFGYTFGKAGHKQAPYLTRTLPSRGALLSNYYGIGHDSLDNYIAQISGQAPDYQTGQDCEYFEQFIQFGGENFDKWTKYGQLSGDGCVYPRYVRTVANQLTARHLTWRAYEQNMGIDPHRDGTTRTAHGPACGHPPLNKIDLTDTTGPANDSYATRHDPFVYFHSIIGNQAYCDAHVVDLRPLAGSLKHLSATPNYSFITPDTCADAHDTPRCQNGAEGRAAAGQPVPQGVDPADHALPGLPGGRAHRGHLRRVGRRHGRRPPAAARRTAWASTTRRTRTSTSRACTGRAAAGSAPCCCPGSSGRARSARCPTTTTRCCAASRTCSGWPTWATRSSRRCTRSGATSTRGSSSASEMSPRALW